jgi:hypothetical protein
MVKRCVVFVIAWLAAGFALCACSLEECDTKGTSARPAAALVGKPAPGFKLPDTTGKVRTLSEFAGKTVVLEWINFECPCVRKHYESGNMQHLQKTYMPRGVVWLCLNSSAPGKSGYYPAKEIDPKLVARHATPTAYLLDPDGVVGKAYQAKATPHMFVINAKGILVYAGAIDDKPTAEGADIKTAHNYVAAALDAVLSGKPVPNAQTTAYGCPVKYK